MSSKLKEKCQKQWVNVFIVFKHGDLTLVVLILRIPTILFLLVLVLILCRSESFIPSLFNFLGLLFLFTFFKFSLRKSDFFLVIQYVQECQLSLRTAVLQLEINTVPEFLIYTPFPKCTCDNLTPEPLWGIWGPFSVN